MTKEERIVLKYLADTGSTWAPIDELKVNVVNSVKSGALCFKKHNDKIFVTFPYYQNMEKNIARALFTRSLQKVSVDINAVEYFIEKFERLESERIGKTFEYAIEQKEGIVTIVSNYVSILTGGPGTGKTSVLKCAAQVIKWLNHIPAISFTAPTGKAARRITESSGYPATTIQKKIGDTGSECKKLKTICDDFVFIDEVSMLDLPTFDKVLTALHPITRICLVGDVDQLPSVGIGAVLRDLIDSRVISCCQLEKTFRQDNDSQLFANIMICKKGGWVPFEEGPDFVRIRTEKDILNNCIQQYLNAIKEYGLDNTIILTPYRKEGTICSEKINALLQKIINPIGSKPYFRTTVYRDEGRPLPIVFQEGDPVIQLENRGEIANGDVGTIIRVDGFAVTVKYCDCVITYRGRELNQLDLAYALSIHKSQGSEYKCVIIPFLKENRNLDRNMIYTGITRAKKVCIVLGEDKVIQDACKIQSAWIRNTFLAEELQIYKKTMDLRAMLSA